MLCRDFPGDPVAKNPPANLGDLGSSPGPGTKIPYDEEQLSPYATTRIWALEPSTSNYWAHMLKLLQPGILEPVLPNCCSEKPEHRNERNAVCRNEKPLCRNENWVWPKY